MSDLIFHILKRHPYKGIKIRHLCLKNENFRSICEDYGKCAEAIEYWEQSRHPNAKKRVDEYHYLCTELEKEALQGLQHGQEPYDKQKQPKDH